MKAVVLKSKGQNVAEHIADVSAPLSGDFLDSRARLDRNESRRKPTPPRAAAFDPKARQAAIDRPAAHPHVLPYLVMRRALKRERDEPARQFVSGSAPRRRVRPRQ